MKLPVAFRFTKLEVGFLLAAFVVLAVGTAISIHRCEADWMPGVGALMIVLGVVFALFDLPNLLQLKADQWARVRKEFAVHSRIEEIEEETHTVLSQEERSRIRNEVEKDIDKHLPSHGPTIRKRFHAVEVFIVCLGTLVNGFGQKFLEWLFT
jgi:hypothetical protein